MWPWGFGLGVWKTADVSARSALKIVIGYGQMREISWIWGQTREILPLWQTCEISDARHPHTTHPCEMRQSVTSVLGHTLTAVSAHVTDRSAQVRRDYLGGFRSNEISASARRGVSVCAASVV